MTSPVGAHAVFLKERYGSDVKVIFAGPCAAKKLEADDPDSGLEIALTFKRLNRWLTEEGIDLNGEAAAGAAFEPVGAEEGRLYAFEGGMVETVRSLQNDEKTVYLTVSGLNNMDRLLSGSVPQNTDVKLFIECLACEGGCVNGPGMPGRGDRLEDILRIARPGCMKSSENRKDTTEIRKQFTPEPIEKTDAGTGESRVRGYRKTQSRRRIELRRLRLPNLPQFCGGGCLRKSGKGDVRFLSEAIGAKQKQCADQIHSVRRRHR